MPTDGRVPFTKEDRQLLAEFLSKIPANKRAAPSNFKEFAKRHPHHTEQSWHTHYRKSGREDVDRRIAIIKRQRESDKDAAKKRAAESPRANASDGAAQRDGKGKGKAVERSDEEADVEDEEEEDQLDEEEEEVVIDAGPAKASSSKARPSSAGPSSKPAQAPAKKKRPHSPTPSSSSGDSSDNDRSSRKKPKKRVPFDADDFETLVIMLDKADRKEWTRQIMYQKLEQECPAHTAASWQTYHSQKREAADKALKKLRKGLKRTTEGKTIKESKPATIDASDSEGEKERRRREKGKGKARDVVRQSSDGQWRLSQAAFASTYSERPAAKALADEPSSASSSDAGAKSAAAKIKSSSKSRSSPIASPQKVTVNDQAEPPFTEEDDAQLVQQLASGMVNGRDQAFVWKELARIQPVHPASSWQARFSSDMSGFLLRITDKIRIAEKARQRKADLEEEKRAAEAEEAWRREEDEAERRKKRKDEARHTKVKAEEGRSRREKGEHKRLEREAEEEERSRREAEEEEAALRDGRKDQARRREQAEAERNVVASGKTPISPGGAEPVKLATPRPSPPRSARPVQAVESEDDIAALAEGPHGKLETTPHASSAAGAASADEHVATAVMDEANDAEAVEEQLEPASSSLALPRFSQYSVMPSPFLQGDEARDDFVEEDEDDRDLDRELATQIKAEEEELDIGAGPETYAEADLAARIDKALGESGSDYSDDDEAPVWNQLDAAETGFIEDVHAQVAMLQQGFTAPRPAEELAAPAASVEREATPAVVEEVRMQETVVVEETVESVEEVEVKQPPGGPPREPFAITPSPQLPRLQKPVKRTLSDVSTQGSPAEHEMQGREKKRPRLDSSLAVAPERVPPRHRPSAPAQGVGAGVAPPTTEATPTTRRRIPRASLAASTPSVAGSPAPAVASTSSQPADTHAQPPQPTPAPAAAPENSAALSAQHRPPLKEVLESIATDCHLSFNRVRNLFYCYSALNDFATFREIASFFSVPFKPDEGSVEYAQAKRAVERYLWSMREDEIVLEGTEAARRRIEEKKGKGAVARRRQFLQKARVNQVSDLARDRYPA